MGLPRKLFPQAKRGLCPVLMLNRLYSCKWLFFGHSSKICELFYSIIHLFCCICYLFISAVWWFGVHVPAAFQALLQCGEQSVPRTLLQEHIHIYFFIFLSLSLSSSPSLSIRSKLCYITALGTVRSTDHPLGTNSYLLFISLSLSLSLSMRPKLCYSAALVTVRSTDHPPGTHSYLFFIS